MLLFVFSIVFAWGAQAQTVQTLSLNGVNAQVAVDDFYDDGSPASGELVDGPINIPMAFGNSVTVTRYFWLGDNGKVTLLTSPGDVSWKRSNGDIIPLNCNKHEEYKNRVVSFYQETGVYRMGCHTSDKVAVEINGGYVDVVYGSALDLNEDGSVAFVATIGKDQSLNTKRFGTVKLRNSSSLGFHSDGTVRFLALAVGEVVEVSRAGKDSVFVTTPAGMKIYTYFYENGMIQKALLAKPLTVKVQSTELTLAAGEPVGMHENGQVGLFRVKTGGDPVIVFDANGLPVPLQDDTLLCLDSEGEIADPQTCKDKFM